MLDETDRETGMTLAQARAIIRRQAQEIEHLRRTRADETFAERLRDTVMLAGMAGTIAAPVSHTRLLEMIVETAVQVIAARAGSLFLIDEEAQELIFEVALGEKADVVKKLRVPLGHGIAGYVAVTGQPLAISNVQNDPRHASDIAQEVGYQPGNILCVPLFYNDQIIGVLELLDKQGDASFTPDDMSLLGVFANQAAVAIEQSRTHQNLTALIGETLVSLGKGTSDQEARRQARTFGGYIEGDPMYRQALDLAQQVQAIAAHGEREIRACSSILGAFADYLSSGLYTGSEPDVSS